MVKAITRPRQKFFAVVAVMRKVRGANPRHNDWVMTEYSRPSRSGRFSAFASGAICTGCHLQVRGRAYVFTRRSR